MTTANGLASVRPRKKTAVLSGICYRDMVADWRQCVSGTWFLIGVSVSLASASVLVCDSPHTRKQLYSVECAMGVSETSGIQEDNCIEWNVL